MMPTRHQHDVTKDRVVLLYEIVSGKGIDVGRVIHASIMRYIIGGTSDGIPHVLITRLCSAAVVQWAASEPLQLPTNTIDHITIQKYKVWEGGVSHVTTDIL